MLAFERGAQNLTLLYLNIYRDQLGNVDARLVFEFSPPSLEATSRETGAALFEYLESLGYRLEVISPDLARGEAVGGAVILNRFASVGSEHFDLLAIPDRRDPIAGRLSTESERGGT